MILVNLKKEDVVLKLLAPSLVEVELILANQNKLFELHRLLATGIDVLIVNSKTRIKIIDLLNELSHLKEKNIIGYPLQLCRGELYALNKKITITDVMTFECISKEVLLWK